MSWSWSWNFWRKRSRGPGAAGAKRDGGQREPRLIEDWETGLVERGVAAEWAARLAPRLAPIYTDLGRGSAEALIQATVVAVEVQAETQASVERNMRDVREVERLLGAFSGELEKLDEVLEVLAAYAQRMRAKPAKAPRRTLH